MQQTRRGIAVVLALILIVLSAAPCLAEGEQDPVVATVNGQPVLASQLREQLLRRWGDIALGALIQELAVQQAAAEAGISVTEDEVTQRVENFQKNVDVRAQATGESFSLWLARKKMTPYAFRQWVRNELLLEKMIEDQVEVTDDQVREAWEASREQMRQPERMRVSHICVKTREEAESIREEIIGGKPFEDAASEYSIDPYTKDKGGSFGVITRGDNPFQVAAFKLETDNELSEPVQTEKGWHIIRRDEYLPATTPNFEDVADEIRERLEQQQKLELMNQKRTEIMQQARVEHEIDPEELAE